MWVLYVVGRLLLPRWPALLVPPAFAYAGYTGWQAVALGLLAILLAELVFAVATVLLLDREWRR